MNAREQFALYLEAAGSVEATARLARLHGGDALARVQEDWSGRVTTLGLTPDAVKAALGAPDAENDNRLFYRLAWRRGYLYTFVFELASGRLSWSGFERDGPTPSVETPRSASTSWAAFVTRLASVGATEAELRSWLGEPGDRYGWWPAETWDYPLGSLSLRHGVVEAGAAVPA